MQLSEAIRLGAMLRKQNFRHVFQDGRTCAIGAAAEAIGLLDTTRENAWKAGEQTPDSWRWIRTTAPLCPVCATAYEHVEFTITHLNDFHRWTREAIAEWVATIEPPQAPSEADASAESDVLQATHAEVVVT